MASRRVQERHDVEILGREAALRLDLYRFDGLELSPVSRPPLAARFAEEMTGNETGHFYVWQKEDISTLL